MNETISNERFSVTVSEYGAELQSVTLDGVQRLWQGDASVWGDRAPILFPFVGRIKGEKYTFEGNEYSVKGAHGFARASTFTLIERTESSLTYRLTSSPDTKKEYPFDFIFDVIYSIKGTALTQTFVVHNTGNRDMYYSVGAHPGFLVPPSDGSEFSDWYLQFSEGEVLSQAMLDGLFMSRRVEPCRFARGNCIPLTHQMFDDDAFILTGLKRKVFELKNHKNNRRIVVDCSDFRYLAFWQAVGSGANYLCIEPWNGLPSNAEDPEDLSVKRDLRLLPPKSTERASVSFLFE